MNQRMRRYSRLMLAALLGLLPLSTSGLILCVDHDGHVAIERYCTPSACCPAEECELVDSCGNRDRPGFHAQRGHTTHPCNDTPLISAAEKTRSAQSPRAGHQGSAASFGLAHFANPGRTVAQSANVRPSEHAAPARPHPRRSTVLRL